MLHAKEKRITSESHEKELSGRSRIHRPSCVSERCKFTLILYFSSFRASLCVSRPPLSWDQSEICKKWRSIVHHLCIWSGATLVRQRFRGVRLGELCDFRPRRSVFPPSKKWSTTNDLHGVVSVPLLPSSDALKARAMYHKKPKRMMCLDGSASAKLEC